MMKLTRRAFFRGLGVTAAFVAAPTVAIKKRPTPPHDEAVDALSWLGRQYSWETLKIDHKPKPYWRNAK